jgi:hypothetical protein
MRRIGLVAATLLLAGCGGGAASAPRADVCGEAFAAAASVDETADTVSDLYRAVRACTTVEAWTAAFDANGGAGFTGSAESVLTNVCTAPEISEEPLCKLVQ